MISNIGRWSGWKDSGPIQLGAVESYKQAIAWLDGYGDIVDWGGGTGYARRFIAKSGYSVLDGSKSQMNDALVDLASVHSISDCILLRHVLEHNHDWLDILTNMVASFRCRAVVVTFMPFASEVTLVDHEEQEFIGSVGQHVPVLRLSYELFLSVIQPYLVIQHQIGTEIVFCLEKR